MDRLPLLSRLELPGRTRAGSSPSSSPGSVQRPGRRPVRQATTRWVLSAADGQYLLGEFDGRTFTPKKEQLWYGNFYAAQTFSDTPDGRQIQIGWANGITFPGEPFNQQMTVACCAVAVRVPPRPAPSCATGEGADALRRSRVIDAVAITAGFARSP